MSNKRKRTTNGFTLVELVIVMALFSIIMLAVIRIANPASKIMKNTTISENTYATTNNIETYLKGQMQYADALWVLNGDQLGSDFTFKRAGIVGESVNFSNDIKKAAGALVKECYSNVVEYGTGTVKGFTNTKFVEGSVYIMKLSNSDGKIYLSEYGFKADENDCTVSATAKFENELQLNTIFGATENNYEYRYVLGAHDFAEGVNANNCRVLADTEVGTVSKDNLAVSIVVNQKGTSHAVGEFPTPCSLSVANIPLINIINSGVGRVSRRIALDKTTEADGTEKYSLVHPTTNVTPFKTFVNPSVDFSNDIYFIYTYANELK